MRYGLLISYLGVSNGSFTRSTRHDGAFDGRFAGFVKIAEKQGALDEKTKHLTLISLAVAFQCTWCIAIHTKGCVDAGASKDEILEAAMMAVVMGGGPKLMYMEVLYEELDKYFK